MRVHFIVNPMAGRVRYGKLVAAIREELSKHDIHITSSLPEALPEQSIRSTDGPQLPFDEAPPDMVVAVGGDGTVNRVINAVARRGVPVGILPCGSANDLAGALGIPEDFSRACAIIKSVHMVKIDLISVNGTYFATCGGLGVAAAVAQRVNRWKGGARRKSNVARVLGKKVYLLAALVELGRTWRPVHGRIVGNGDGRQVRWASLLVCNQPQFGGFSPAPMASNCDGILDLCEVRSPPQRGRMLWVSLQALRGRAHTCPEVTQHRATAVTIDTDRPVPFLGDGEILAVAQRFNIEVKPGALCVAVPDGGKAWEGE